MASAELSEASLAHARADLAAQGWALLRGLPFATYGTYGTAGTADEEAVLTLAERFGTPSDRDGGRAVWPVSPRAGHRTGTFSIRAGGAGFHTDSQYHARPEDIVCLFVVRPAARGGDTLLVTERETVSALHRHLDGQAALGALADPVWRWRTPEVYGTAEQQRPVPVLPGDGTVRWRADNLAARRPGRESRAAAVLLDCLESAVAPERIEQRPGDLIVIDNHRTMHARTGFRDPRRLLLRVRLWGRP
ncbi:Taurine dioxygenase, alpha-ketoglutarate-dependent [Sinosporangium album]|uniref:Taurine dioxygenase, alpha-ketoglutarate-dependent n=1 Tax=Sinosporangium album TaxID=504805 RepID=A0A1G7X4V1_9ACTN|nr:TauD/TfdA family dioxygenase [Sinosporangium album]SDG79202.1 Taurine dioxygenase, alpha-ketoglutarate-dependent [Sinosporangium album]